jgi:hypothetical protein
MNANILTLKKWHIGFFSERQAARDHFRLSFTQTYILAIVMITSLGIYYVWMLNQNATRGYNIRTLQVQYRALSFQENLLDIRIAEGKSIDTILRGWVVSTMQNVDASSFLVVRDATFTQKN